MVANIKEGGDSNKTNMPNKHTHAHPSNTRIMHHAALTRHDTNHGKKKCKDKPSGQGVCHLSRRLPSRVLLPSTNKSAFSKVASLERC